MEVRSRWSITRWRTWGSESSSVPAPPALVAPVLVGVVVAAVSVLLTAVVLVSVLADEQLATM